MRAIKIVILLVILVAAGIGGPRLWNYLSSFETTDDAQIDGDIYPITSRINGTVLHMKVIDNQAVEKGQELVELDPKDFDMAVELAKSSLHESQSLVNAVRPNLSLADVATQMSIESSVSELENARAQLAEAQKERESALADVRTAEADVVKAQGDLTRYKQLVDKDEISRQQYDRADAEVRSLASKVEAKRLTAEAYIHSIEAAQARIRLAQTHQTEVERTRPQQMALQSALVESRQATAGVQRTRLDNAVLTRSYTTILSPVTGLVGKKSVAPGQQVAAGQQLMFVIPREGLWVTANFKETQLKNVRTGMKVTVHVDAYDKELEGYVDDFAGASGAKFSLLPPENATGNFVKVVQRVPVRIRLKPGQDPEHLLRPGMSVDPKVWLHK